MYICFLNVNICASLNDYLFKYIYPRFGINIWRKMEQSSKTGQEQKSVISVFACFLTAIIKV